MGCMVGRPRNRAAMTTEAMTTTPTRPSSASLRTPSLDRFAPSCSICFLLIICDARNPNWTRKYVPPSLRQVETGPSVASSFVCKWSKYASVLGAASCAHRRLDVRGASPPKSTAHPDNMVPATSLKAKSKGSFGNYEAVLKDVSNASLTPI